MPGSFTHAEAGRDGIGIDIVSGASRASMPDERCGSRCMDV